jgi:uncharacterized protein YdaU (DUF1376 family)
MKQPLSGIVLYFDSHFAVLRTLDDEDWRPYFELLALCCESRGLITQHALEDFQKHMPSSVADRAEVVLEECSLFVRTGRGWRHKLVDKQLRASREHSLKQSANARARWDAVKNSSTESIETRDKKGMPLHATVSVSVPVSAKDNTTRKRMRVGNGQGTLKQQQIGAAAPSGLKDTSTANSDPGPLPSEPVDEIPIWWKSEHATTTMAARMGVQIRPGESFEDLRSRMFLRRTELVARNLLKTSRARKSEANDAKPDGTP